MFELKGSKYQAILDSSSSTGIKFKDKPKGFLGLRLILETPWSSFGILFPESLVKSNGQHQNNGQNDYADHTINPVERISQSDQKNYGKKYQCGPLVPNAHVVRGIFYLILLQLSKHKVGSQMVNDQE